MTVSSSIVKKSYVGNGAQVDFSYPYLLLEDDDLVVVYVDTTTDPHTEEIQELNVDYTIAGIQDDQEAYPNGVTVTMDVAPLSDDKLIIYNGPDMLQGYDHVENEAFLADAVEQVYDKLTLITQRLSERIDRSVAFMESAPESGILIPTISGQGSKALRVNSGEDAFEWYDLTNLNLYEVSALAGTLLAYTTKAEWNTELIGISALSALSKTLLVMTTKAAWIAELSVKFKALEDLTWAADKILQFTGAATVSARNVSEFGVLAVEGAWTKAQRHPKITLTDDGGVAVNMDLDMNAYLLLSGDYTLSAPSNIMEGRSIILEVKQDGGNQTLSFNAAYDFAGTDNLVNLTDTKRTIFWFHSPDGSNVVAKKLWEDN